MSYFFYLTLFGTRLKIYVKWRGTEKDRKSLKKQYFLDAIASLEFGYERQWVISKLNIGYIAKHCAIIAMGDRQQFSEGGS